MWSFSYIAPTGHTSIHCPQLIQGESFKLLPKEGATIVLNPLFTIPIANTFCTSEHTDTHLLQSTHLFGSLTIEGEALSIEYFIFSPSNLISSTPNFLDND